MNDRPVMPWHRAAAQEIMSWSRDRLARTPTVLDYAQLIARASPAPAVKEERGKLMAALAHAAYRTHDPAPAACSGCEAVAKFLNDLLSESPSTSLLALEQDVRRKTLLDLADSYEQGPIRQDLSKYD